MRWYPPTAGEMDLRWNVMAVAFDIEAATHDFEMRLERKRWKTLFSNMILLWQERANESGLKNK